MKTYYPKPEEIERDWYVLDATDKNLGHLASRVATILRGKHKPTFTPSVDVGDYVIIVNADKVSVNSRRLDDKFYYRHSYYPGGLRKKSLREMLESDPRGVVERAVRGMLPKNRLGRAMAKKMKVYVGDTHPHQGQQPKELEWD